MVKIMIQEWEWKWEREWEWEWKWEWKTLSKERERERCAYAILERERRPPPNERERERCAYAILERERERHRAAAATPLQQAYNSKLFGSPGRLAPPGAVALVAGASAFFTHTHWDLETTMTTFNNNFILRTSLEQTDGKTIASAMKYVEPQRTHRSQSLCVLCDLCG